MNRSKALFMKDSAAPIRAFLFDWDGTLIDSLPLKIANAADLFAERFGADSKEVRESYARHSGVPRRILFDRISYDCRGTTLSNVEYDSLSDAFTERNRQSVSKNGALRPGAMSTLLQLQESGVLLYISTSAEQDEIDSLAGHFGLGQICHGIYGSRPSFSKGPDHAREVIELHGLSHADVAGVGDDVVDMELFRAAGIHPIGITGTRSRAELEEAGAEIVIDSLEDILTHVG